MLAISGAAGVWLGSVFLVVRFFLHPHRMKGGAAVLLWEQATPV